MEYQFILHHTGDKNLPNDLHWEVVFICVAILPNIIVRNVWRHKEKIYVGHEALRVTKQFEE